MRIPTRLLEHPVEAAIASILLLTLLVGSADIKPPPRPEQTPVNAAAEKA